ncbi:PIR protein [Plasmodium yoelii]|uniref:YIR protein n=1 Tax=Plasmodium yoelii TaxID=5861 RepID=A0A4V0KV09_PLAYE|nr:PIR protein [Plasmodium yoelii]VTZ81331.1 PIR protein [Plasmodium yoelii]|eukprot:XP_022812787.1 PIR protein [Plasmodium yoelii]
MHFLKFIYCNKFDTVRSLFPDELDSGEYKFKAAKYKDYFSKSEYTNIDKINGCFLWLLKIIFENSNNFSGGANENIIIVTYIFSWLSYKLNQKTENGITKLNEFYSKYIENVQEYKGSIEKNTQYKTYIEVINKNKKLMDIDISVMSKFYDVFKNLCKMYDDLSKANNNSQEYLKYVNIFVDNYKALINENFNDTNNNLFSHVLSVLLNDYNYIKSNLYNESVKKQFPELTKEKTKAQAPGSSFKGTQMDDSSGKMPVSISQTEESISQTKVSDSETTLFSSLTINNLIPIPLILVATLILLGISYKYSLFGFRKRSQKQYLREKLKK